MPGAGCSSSVGEAAAPVKKVVMRGSLLGAELNMEEKGWHAVTRVHEGSSGGWLQGNLGPLLLEMLGLRLRLGLRLGQLVILGPAPPAAPGPAPRPQAPPWGRWLDRDTNGCLNMQRIGERMQRPLELFQWKDLEALPPIGKKYQQRHKLVDDRLPKVRQRLHRAAEYRRGIDGRARNNA
ncbi:hypothetical protein QJQ45_012050 [Haematococcus lacustris]|nr:hypothetical protein QJQ45_012050 [Haematococcus lacustris]